MCDIVVFFVLVAAPESLFPHHTQNTYTMIRQARHLLQRAQRSVLQRTAFHSSAVLSADALDMVDTFARRHCKLEVGCFGTLCCSSWPCQQMLLGDRGRVAMVGLWLWFAVF